MCENERPRIGITLGDPSGIGPEVLAKVLPEVQERCEPVLYGCAWALNDGAAASGTELNTTNGLEIVDIGIPRPRQFAFGEVLAECGTVAVQSVERAIDDALQGNIRAIMTCPLHKEAINAAGYTDIGHQEILGRLTKSESVATMLMTPGLRVVHLSTHKSLINAARFVTRDNVLEKLRLCASTFATWGLPNARIGVAALNPHGGEGGLLGREELDELIPAVEAAKEEGIQALGPFPSDSIFNKAIGGDFDVVLAMYHDQGHIAIKVHNFHESISATLGIPFVRTSVDHGTAFDIAGKGIADPRSTLAAIDAAINLSTGRLTDSHKLEYSSPSQ
ncbi:MAG: 4-hydroxythreonine-4-phosphate dehydrogenase PdxA [Gammaproteobacteria bacterium]|nr:4-hydroxythreonine-4-phosphate dehydrogenase PdxA [Gammaproteobacteria bacterium]